MRLRVVVAEDNAAFLQEFISILGAEFEIVATAADGRAALEHICRCRPDVAVLDLQMPLLNGIEVTKELIANPPAPAIVVCSVETDPEIVEAARQAGALGFVFKTSMANDLITAVKSAARGEFFASRY